MGSQSIEYNKVAYNLNYPVFNLETPTKPGSPEWPIGVQPVENTDTAQGERHQTPKFTVQGGYPVNSLGQANPALLSLGRRQAQTTFRRFSQNEPPGTPSPAQPQTYIPFLLYCPQIRSLIGGTALGQSGVQQCQVSQERSNRDDQKAWRAIRAKEVVGTKELEKETQQEVW